MSKIIGLTGQSGAGKSLISSLLKNDGYQVINCDLFAKEVIDHDLDCQNKLKAAFGGCFDDNRLNRKKLGKLVFSDKTALKKLDEIVNPLILKSLKQEILNTTHPVIILDGATLIQCGASLLCHKLIGIFADRETRILRIMARDSLDRQDAAARVDSQKSEQFYKAGCTNILYNQGEIAKTYQLVKNIIEEEQS